ncbi:MAG TPA: hypothetical protein VGZ47_07260 [Gemmataceae bacterium]|jgi:hypothetical protein|nr:hypothetical protein [Gemmataceae bacterium]
MDRPDNLDGWPNPDFLKNQSAYPTEELWKHINQYVAWNWDGTVILASAATEDEVIEQVRAIGLDISKVVIDFVFDPNVSWIGGLTDANIINDEASHPE